MLGSHIATTEPVPAIPQHGYSGADSNRVELRGGSNSKEGNIFVNGSPVCDDYWDEPDAVVACRMLG